MREELDFKSLRFFSALYRLGNVSPAAEALDISQMTLLPLLQSQLQRLDASGITFTVLDIDDQTLSALGSGKCDLAIGYLTQLPDSVYQQHLFDQSYVCLAAENHPRIRHRFSAEDWRQEKHLAVRVNGTVRQQFVA